MKTATGVECLFAKGDDGMEDKTDKPDKKEKKKQDRPFFEKHELIIGTFCILILFGIAIFAWQIDYKDPAGTYPTDTNTTDTNNTITPTDAEFLKEIADEDWCMNQYLHRRPILYINAINNETGKTNTMRLQEAKDLNLVQDNTDQEIYMENIDKTGLLCGNYLYFDFRNAYKICYQVPDENLSQCFKASIEELGDWVRLYPDLNTSDTNGDVV